MLKQVCVVVATALLLTTAVRGQDSRDGYGDVHVSLNGGDNVVYIGETNTVEFWIMNDATLYGMSIGFEYTIMADYFFDPNHGGAGHYVQEHGRAIDAFNLGGLQEITAIDDLSPDSLYFGGGALPGYGLPAGPLELCYTMQFDLLPGQPEVPGGFSIDNIFMPPAGNWAFSDDAGGYPPDFQGNPNSSMSNPDAPPVVFDVVIRANTPPEITNCPSVPITMSLGEIFSHQFVAYDPDPGDELTWMIVEGPGAITTDGHYDFVPDYPDMFTVVIRVEDQTLDFDECVLMLHVINTAPVITNCEGYFEVTEHCELFEYHFEASDPDPGDILTWMVVSGEGSINSATGLYMLNPQPYTGTVLTVGIQVSDPWGESSECWFDIGVLNNIPEYVSSCGETVVGVPGSSLEYLFEAIDQDPCDPLTYAIESAIPEPLGEYYLIEGEFFFEPLPEEVGGNFEFTVSAHDGWDQTGC